MSSFNPLPSTALCQLLIVDRIFPPPFFSQEKIQLLGILAVTDLYVRPVFGSCNASLKSLMSIPGIEPSCRQFINRLSMWL